MQELIQVRLDEEIEGSHEHNDVGRKIARFLYTALDMQYSNLSQLPTYFRIRSLKNAI